MAVWNACGAATPSSASLLRSRRAVARACIPCPRELVGRRVPRRVRPVGCMHMFMYPEYMGVEHVRAHDGCTQRLARRWRLQLIQRPRQRAQRRRPKHVAHDGRRGGDREGPQARTSRYFLSPLRNHSLTRILTHILCDEFRVISHFHSHFRVSSACDGGDAVAVSTPL